jgi:hypothetical protein
MSDDTAVECLEKYYDFRYIDFLKLTKTTDFFNLLNPSSDAQPEEQEPSEVISEATEVVAEEIESIPDSSEVIPEETDPIQEGAPLEESCIVQADSIGARRKTVYDTSKHILKRISPKLFIVIKGIYLGFKY